MITRTFTNEEVVNRQDDELFVEEAANRFCELIQLMIETGGNTVELSRTLRDAAMWEDRYLGESSAHDRTKDELVDSKEQISTMKEKLRQIDNLSYKIQDLC